MRTVENIMCQCIVYIHNVSIVSIVRFKKLMKLGMLMCNLRPHSVQYGCALYMYMYVQVHSRKLAKLVKLM